METSVKPFSKLIKSANSSIPFSKVASVSSDTIEFIVKGQGVFIFQNKNCDNLIFYILDSIDGYKVEIADKVTLSRVSDGVVYIDPNNVSGLVNNKSAYYWISVDSHNQTIKLGVGEARVETIIYQYQFNGCALKLNSVKIASDNLSPLQLLRDPVTSKIPGIIKDTDELTIDDIASGLYLPKSNLALTAQSLYHCIAGKNFILNDTQFPDFSRAITYSINTPGCWCNQKLKDKSNEFNKSKPNILETYLRITLGQNNGESPGVPYVIEIWPTGHYSPIHNHSDAHAIIRVLNGAIHVKQFPFLCPSTAKPYEIKPFSVTKFKQNDVTWISPIHNQTHQLKNKNKDVCVTIQCYMYSRTDNTHYEYFDYIDSDGNIQLYEPDSDMEFTSFKKLMKQEWEFKKKTCFNCF